MKIKVIQSDGEYTYIALSGRLDQDGVKAIEQEFTSLVPDKGKPAIIDMTEVSFLESAGMKMLLDAAEKLCASHAKIVLYNPQPVIHEALQTAGIFTVMPIENDFAKAIALMKV